MKRADGLDIWGQYNYTCLLATHPNGKNSFLYLGSSVGDDRKRIPAKQGTDVSKGKKINHIWI